MKITLVRVQVCHRLHRAVQRFNITGIICAGAVVVTTFVV